MKDMNEAWLAEAGLSPTPRGMFFLFVYHAECVFLIVPYSIEMFNLGKMKFDGGASSGSVVPSVTCASASVVDVGSTAEKRPSIDEGSSLRKRSKRATPKQLVDTSGSTIRVPPEKGKELVELEETPERGYTIRELCEVEDWVGADKYFASIMTRLKTIEGEDSLVPRWSAISRSSQVWTEGPLSREYLRGALHPALAKQVCECSSEELMNKAGKSAVWFGTSTREFLALRAANKGLKLGASQNLVVVAELHAKGLEKDVNKLRAELESLNNQRRDMEQEVGVLRSSLDGARNDRARLEGDVLSLIEAPTLLEVELKAEGPKAVAAHKASRGFESGLEKMGRVSYEFGYRVALKWLREKHSKIAIEQDLFAECPDEANVEMDLN
ncbi:hypothetical protein BHM03_00014910 [Ensete ventricosum]|nr:hypothetical protein BHM03_00014910 [Ensete ventricosum]